jgi:hypothetical protein
LAASVTVHGIDRRNGFGPGDIQRRPAPSGRPAFESEEASVTTPSASQFSTDIAVEKPVPLSEN